MSEQVFEGTPLSEYHADHPEICHLQQELSDQHDFHLPILPAAVSFSFHFCMELQVLINEFVRSGSVPDLRRGNNLLHYIGYPTTMAGFATLLLSTRISLELRLLGALVLLPICLFSWTCKFIHSALLFSIFDFLSTRYL